MNKNSMDTGFSLLQQNPSREILLQKMRGKLASTPSIEAKTMTRQRDVRQRTTATWGVRVLMLAGFLAINWFAIGHRDVFVAKPAKHKVAVLPVPGTAYSTDDQALYYAYALYDYPMLKERFGISGAFAVDQGHARAKLDALLGEVSPQTLGIISAYIPMDLERMVARRMQ
jgi:hypothetical protein